MKAFLLFLITTISSVSLLANDAPLETPKNCVMLSFKAENRLGVFFSFLNKNKIEYKVISRMSGRPYVNVIAKLSSTERAFEYRENVTRLFGWENEKTPFSIEFSLINGPVECGNEYEQLNDISKL